MFPGLHAACTRSLREVEDDRPVGILPVRSGRQKSMLIRRGRPLALNLALQGGGAHGAFTWGVLEHLLDAGSFRYDGVSGTSAGAFNAVLFASGWLEGGAGEAKAKLEAFWREVAEIAQPLHSSSLAQIAVTATAQMISPYQFNPFDINPLRQLLERLVDFERLRDDRSLRLLIATTALRTGSLRLFTNRELSAEVVLASACLPWLHQAVEIEGEPYWDGGYVSNPPLVPLVERCRTPDVLLVRINPHERSALPTSTGEIRNRVGEIVFDQPLKRELAQLEAGRGTLAAFSTIQRRLARHRLHVIDGGEALVALDPDTKMVPSWEKVTYLRYLGHTAAARWLVGDVDGCRKRPRDSDVTSSIRKLPMLRSLPI